MLSSHLLMVLICWCSSQGVLTFAINDAKDLDNLASVGLFLAGNLHGAYESSDAAVMSAA